ncbi:hypothetical protein [Comamonas sp. C11]|uniref:hypothetical protein n=1 Tax=Comamonas sp. C11 TaxID=2966554 RepID=UPI0021136659|nr:hypothetical protein [Comamonas sp. C11]UUC91696.1 hypothetical protein NOX35_15440 [Comamonas sp. C11]
MSLKFKIYFPSKNTARDDLITAQHCVDTISLGKVLLREKNDYKYAVYFYYKDRQVTDHNYYSEIDKDFDIDNLVSIEIFCKNDKGHIFRIIGANPDSELVISEKCALKYRHTKHGSNDLVIYFDYSRLVEKVILHQEFIPQFNFKTKKDVLIMSNALGYWGTCTSFDDNGIFIFPKIALFINKLIDELSYKRVFLVGGSQGASAALVYAAGINNVEHVFAAAPVEINRKNSLRHLDELISSNDLDTINNIFCSALEKSKISLFSTLADEHNLFHKKLSKFNGVIEYEECDDPDVTHGKCLRHYIKKIYKTIESY